MRILIEIFYGVVLLSFLILLIFTPILIIYNKKYLRSLKLLIEALPEEGFDKLKRESKKGMNTLKKYFIGELKAQFKQPDYLTNLITSTDYDGFGIAEVRRKCLITYKSYKFLFLINVITFAFLVLSAIVISFYYSNWL